VYTASLEWLALLLAAGCEVLIKAPSDAPLFLYTVADHFSAAGFLVRVTTSRDLEQPDAILGFGADETLQQVVSQWPEIPTAMYGHRFSVVWAEEAGQATAIAKDVALYDTRGCMAPAAIFVPAAQAQPFAEALGKQLEKAQAQLPRGTVSPSLGPEWRRRIAIARVRGTVLEGEQWAVAVSPAADLTPATLPRLAMVHPIEDEDELHRVLSPWRDQLSTLAAADADVSMLQRVRNWFPRVCMPGEMQAPPFPRWHDGQPMLASLMRPEEDR